MISVDKALSIYTDNIIKDKNYNANEFRDQMTQDDFSEFIELAQFADLVMKDDDTKRYEGIFKQLNDHKHAIYDVPTAANFRTIDGRASMEAEKNVERIFDEEFKNE